VHLHTHISLVILFKCFMCRASAPAHTHLLVVLFIYFMCPASAPAHTHFTSYFVNILHVSRKCTSACVCHEVQVHLHTHISLVILFKCFMCRASAPAYTFLEIMVYLLCKYPAPAHTKKGNK